MGQYLLTLDRTNWKFGQTHINILCLAIVQQSVAIPVLSILLDKTGNSNTDEHIPLINRFIELFGVEKIDGYLADRGFIGTELVLYLIKNEIKLRIRIQHNTRVARCRNGTAPAYNFFLNLPRGEVIQLRGQRVVWGQKLSVTGTRLMSGESLIILSPDASRVTAVLGDDKRRWEIETLFKTLKSQGFDFEATRLTGLDRIERLLALLTIIFCWAHLLGDGYTSKNRSQSRVIAAWPSVFSGMVWTG